VSTNRSEPRDLRDAIEVLLVKARMEGWTYRRTAVAIEDEAAAPDAGLREAAPAGPAVDVDADEV